MAEEDCIWKQHLASFDLLIGWQHVFNEFSKTNPFTLKNPYINFFLNVELVALLDLSFANSAAFTEEVRVSFVLLSMLD